MELRSPRVAARSARPRSRARLGLLDRRSRARLGLSDRLALAAALVKPRARSVPRRRPAAPPALASPPVWARTRRLHLAPASLPPPAGSASRRGLERTRRLRLVREPRPRAGSARLPLSALERPRVRWEEGSVQPRVVPARVPSGSKRAAAVGSARRRRWEEGSGPPRVAQARVALEQRRAAAERVASGWRRAAAERLARRLLPRPAGSEHPWRAALEHPRRVALERPPPRARLALRRMVAGSVRLRRVEVSVRRSRAGSGRLSKARSGSRRPPRRSPRCADDEIVSKGSSVEVECDSYHYKSRALINSGAHSKAEKLQMSDSSLTTKESSRIDQPRRDRRAGR